MLKTLDENEFRAGFAEIVKAGAIKSPELFSYIENHVDKALMKEPQVIEQLVYDAVRIKADVVETDEREAGERRKLNFGHTFAHAFENLSEILHGEAVSMGMVVASQVSCKLGYLAQAEADRIKNLLFRMRLPVEPLISPALVLSPMRKDKKREGDMLHMVLLRTIGEAMVQKINFKELEGILHDMY
jgi:3-dehydroquinate synthase